MSFLSKLFHIAAPLAISLIPGIGPVAAGALGAGAGLIGGGGIKDALIGGITSGAGNFLAGGSLGNLGSTGANIGNAASSLGVGSTNAAALNGLASSAGVGTGFLGNLGASTGLSSLLGGASKGLSAVGGALGLGGNASGFGNTLNSIGTASGSSGGGLSSLLSTAGNIYSGVQGTNAYKDMAKAQSAGNDKALAALSPFQASGASASNRLSDLLGTSGNLAAEGYGSLTAPFNPGDLTKDPGYQFRLQEGQKGLDRTLGAQGSLFSGKALKAAEQFGQGLADTTYNDAYQRYVNDQNNTYNKLAGQSASGLTAAGGVGSLYGNQGDINANSILGQTNTQNQSLANLLGTNVGGFNGGQGAYYISDYDANGQPIYKKQAGF